MKIFQNQSQGCSGQTCSGSQRFPVPKTILSCDAIRRWKRLAISLALVSFTAFTALALSEETFNNHPVVLDKQGKILPWYRPADHAYDHFLRQRWEFVKTKAPMSPGPEPRSLYPQYYFSCAYTNAYDVLEPDTWMNDIGERIPNWFESARLYYAYTGDASVMKIIKDLIDYTLAHGTSPADFAWPNFPYTTTNAGELEFRGFASAKRFVLHEVQVDHAGDMGLAYFRMYLFTQDRKYLTAAVDVADAVAAHARTGNATQSALPYRVVMDTGRVTAEYGANWAPTYALLRSLIRANVGEAEKYRDAAVQLRAFVLEFPMKTGYWTDGHTDVNINSNTYKSNLSASNTVLYIFDDPEFDPAWKQDVPKLIKWTEDDFVLRTADNEPATQWGANLVGEQDDFNHKMDYQTARYAAETARWYAVSGNTLYKEKAFRALNWVTYTSQGDGDCWESPFTKDLSNWWSDCYGEGPRTFYSALAAVPEWAPAREDHILYTTSILRNVSYEQTRLQYEAGGGAGTDYLRLSFRPAWLGLGKSKLSKRKNCVSNCYRESPWRRGLRGDDSKSGRRHGPHPVIGSRRLLHARIAFPESRPKRRRAFPALGMAPQQSPPKMSRQAQATGLSRPRPLRPMSSGSWSTAR